MGNLASILKKLRTEGRFTLIGIWNTVFGYGIFFLLDTLFYSIMINKRFSYLIAMFVAQILAVINAYFCHKYITFKSRTSGKRLITEFLRFCSSYSLSFLLNLICLSVLVEFFVFTPKVAAAFLIPFTVILNYFLLSGFTFLEADRS